MRPDPKYAPDKYFDQPYRSAAGAIWRGDQGDLKGVFSRKDLQVDYVGKGNYTLLAYSISCQNLKALRFLLKQGADPNLVSPDSVEIGGETVPYPIQPVAYAASQKKSDYLKTLLEAGGNPDSKYSNAPALHEAEEANRMENIKILLNHGANIEGRDRTDSFTKSSLYVRLGYGLVFYPRKGQLACL